MVSLAEEDSELPVRSVNLNPPLCPGKARAVASRQSQPITRWLAVAAYGYRESDRSPCLADTAACLHGVAPLEGRRSVNCQVYFCPILRHFQIPIEEIMRLQCV